MNAPVERPNDLGKLSALMSRAVLEVQNTVDDQVPANI